METLHNARWYPDYVFLFAADIISTVEFNHSGELLATGDKGGRVVIFQQEPEVKLKDSHLPSIFRLFPREKAINFLKYSMCQVWFLFALQKWFILVNTWVQHCFVAAHWTCTNTQTNAQICVSRFRARTSHNVEASTMFTAPSKVTSLSLTTLKALKSRRRLTRFDGCPRKTQHNSFCPQMVCKTIHSYQSDSPSLNL